jgi:hypothetical protein
MANFCIAKIGFLIMILAVVQTTPIPPSISAATVDADKKDRPLSHLEKDTFIQYLLKPDYLSAFDFLKHFALKGQSGAQALLGFMYAGPKIWSKLSVDQVLYQRALIRTHCPFAVSDGHDLPWLLDEFVPGFATQGDNIIV